MRSAEKIRNASIVLMAALFVLVGVVWFTKHVSTVRQDHLRELRSIRPVDGGPNNLLVYRDRFTGCHYVVKSGYGGITPRLGADGEHVGCRHEAPRVRQPVGERPDVKCRDLPPAEPLRPVELEALRDDLIARCDTDAIDQLQYEITEGVSGVTTSVRAGVCFLAKESPWLSDWRCWAYGGR